MTETKDKENEGGEKKKTLSLGGSKGTLTLKGGGAAAGGPSRQNIAQGRGRTVAVEVRRKRTGARADGTEEGVLDTPAPAAAPQQAATGGDALRQLTAEEREARVRALRLAEEESKRRAEMIASGELVEQTPADNSDIGKPVDRALTDEELRKKELEELEKIEAEEALVRSAQVQDVAATHGFKKEAKGSAFSTEDEEEEKSYRERMKKAAPARTPRTRQSEDRWRGGKITVTQALNSEDRDGGGRSLAATRRAREKARLAAMDSRNLPDKIAREVVVPETITVQELSNRMAERGSDLVKALMKMGVMATINQTIDADTAELLIMEFGHKIKRVSDSDIEEGLDGPTDNELDLVERPPVVTIMGHVDHGKTSLLDALRATDVVSGEAGGITQHIGAYQVTMESGAKITFLDTPGHAAFTAMRARGANVTDIVVLVVAANDSIMPQTIEAIAHAKAAGVPIIVAINKIDLPDANVAKVKQDLLQYEVVLEEMGGDTQAVELSAKKRINLDKLEEAILLQAEVLGLKANPNRTAGGTVVEARLEQGRGNVATVLIQQGTLKIGDVIVIGAEWGRIRTMQDDRGKPIQTAVPGQPIEITGLNGAPEAGDKFAVVANEAKARDIAEYRQRKRREAASVISAGEGASAFDLMLAQHREGQKKALSVVIKGDVHGSVEAIIGSLKKLGEENDEVNVNILHSGVGGITESDVILAKASKALIIGFNVRANAQAREQAEREKVDIRYYNIIYNVIDDARAVLTGLLAPALREEYLGQAQIRQVFNITKVGKIAGCMVQTGVVKRGAKVRLLRDDVVIHEGTLKTLKRFKDEVKEVKEGMECGMAFEAYDDIKDGDIIECYQIVEEARTLAG